VKNSKSCHKNNASIIWQLNISVVSSPSSASQSVLQCAAAWHLSSPEANAGILNFVATEKLQPTSTIRWDSAALTSLHHLPSGYVKIAIENGPVEIVDFPINSMVIFHSFLYVYQRVTD